LRKKGIIKKEEGTKYETVSNALGPTWTVAFASFARYYCRVVPARGVGPLCRSVRLDDKNSQLVSAVRSSGWSSRQQAVSIQWVLHMLLFDPGDDAMRCLRSCE